MEKTKTIQTQNTFKGTAGELLDEILRQTLLIKTTKCRNPGNMQLSVEYMVKAHHELMRVLMILDCDSRDQVVQEIKSDNEETTIVGPFKTE